MHQDIANAVYSRIANMLASNPENFTATMDGLAISTEAIDVALGCISRSQAIAAALGDGYLIRATWGYWLLLPLAFGCEDEWPPAGVQDCRDRTARDVMGVAMAA